MIPDFENVTLQTTTANTLQGAAGASLVTTPLACHAPLPGQRSASRWSRATARPLLAGLTLLGFASPAGTGG